MVPDSSLCTRPVRVLKELPQGLAYTGLRGQTGLDFEVGVFFALTHSYVDESPICGDLLAAHCGSMNRFRTFSGQAGLALWALQRAQQSARIEMPFSGSSFAWKVCRFADIFDERDAIGENPARGRDQIHYSGFAISARN